MAKCNYIILFDDVDVITRKMSDEQVGILIRAACDYAFRGIRYSGDDIRVDQAFEGLANQIDRDFAARAKRSKAAEARWAKNTPECKSLQPDAKDAPIQSNPVQSNPIHSNPVQSDRIPQKENNYKAKSKCIQGAAAPAHAGKKTFGKFGWVKLSQQEYDALKGSLGETELKRCIDYLDESCQTNGNKNRWKDFGLVILRCSKEGWGLNQNVTRKEEIPKGASGILGEAELGFIQNALRGEG